MSQIQKAKGKNIFAASLEKQQTIRNNPTVNFFRRLNRPRNNTFNHVQLSKFLRFKYPLAAAIVFTTIFDYGYYFHTDVPSGH